VDVFWISNGVVKGSDPADIDALLAQDDGFVWVDIPVFDDAAGALLAETFGFHPLTLKGCQERSHVPRIQAYPDHLYLVVHAPDAGDPGHVHLLELDQFIGTRYLITTHGPLGEGVALQSALHETQAALERMKTGRFVPASPAELSYAIVSGIARRQDGYVSRLATDIAALERKVIAEAGDDPEELLEEIFKLRHELLTIRTMAAQSREVYARISSLGAFLPDAAMPFVNDLADQFDRVRSICDGEKEFLQGVLDFYQSRVSTKMNVAMERLTLIASILLPISAVAGILGMNIIVNRETNVAQVVIVLGFMAAIVLGMFGWARRKGWW
jgi:Mg2+ and Co2+ transporter CorA